jgi:hypothetical protein
MFGVSRSMARSPHSRDWVQQSERRHRSLRNSAATTAGSALNWTPSYKVSLSDANSKELSLFSFFLLLSLQLHQVREAILLDNDSRSTGNKSPHFMQRYSILQCSNNAANGPYRLLCHKPANTFTYNIIQGSVPLRISEQKFSTHF